MNTNGSKITATVRTIAATIFIAAISIAAFKMRANGGLDTWSFGIALLFGLAGFAFISSIGEVLLLKLWQLEIKFREVQKTEEEVKALASAVLELAESDEGGYKQPTWDAARYEKAKENLRKLVG